MSSPIATLDHDRVRPDDAAVKQLFLDARSHNRWLDTPVDDALLRELYRLTALAPTSANSQPMRIVFVKSQEAKERLRPALAPGNVEKTMTAPVAAIVAHDLEFYEKLPKLMPHVDVRSRFANRPAEQNEQAAFHGGAMQGAYLILAARALGLDCGPIRRLRQGDGRRRVFPGWHVEVEFHREPGLWRSGRSVSAKSATRLRGGVSDRLTAFDQKNVGFSKHTKHKG
jgi:3-hydroxypropanoate dehydrogenase